MFLLCVFLDTCPKKKDFVKCTSSFPSPRYFALLKMYEKPIHYMPVSLTVCKYSNQIGFQKSHDCKLCTQIDPGLG